MPEYPSPSFDCLVLGAIAREAGACLGGRFAGVWQPDPSTVVVGLRTGRETRHLLFSIHPRLARVHLAARPEATERLGSFGLLLRSRLIDAPLVAVEQPPFERVLALSLDALDGAVVLIAEIMGRHSNVILAAAERHSVPVERRRTAADRRGIGTSPPPPGSPPPGPSLRAHPGVVLGALKVVTARMSPRRPVLPGRPYARPPADRPRPDTVTAGDVSALLTGTGPVWQAIAGGILGLGPVLAREIALRAGVDPTMPAADAAERARGLCDALHALADTASAGAYDPALYTRGSAAVAYAAIPLRVYAGLTRAPAASMSEAVDRVTGAAAGTTVLDERRRALAAALGAVERRHRTALEANRRALDESAAAERFRTLGDLLLTYGSRARPGAAKLAVPDPAGAGEITIPLDPALSGVENARRYFRRYAKARAASRAVPARIARLEADLAALEEARVLVETAEGTDDLYEIHADLAARRILRRPGLRREQKRPRTRPAAAPRRYVLPPAGGRTDGAVIIVGRSARENEHVTFHVAGPDDLWLHARGVPGAHVVLRSGQTPSDEDVRTAAAVAAYFSAGRSAGQVAVDCVPRRHVRRLRGAAPGAVVYEGERTLRVTPALPGAAVRATSRATRAPR